VELSDLRRADGILTAFHLVVIEDGRQVAVQDAEAVEWNPPVDPRLFYRQPIALDQVAFSPVAAPPATFATTGTVKVVSQPAGAQLYVDDVAKGTTSESEGRLIVEDIAPGSHRLRVSAAGYQEWTKTVDVEPGDAVEAAATLERAGPLPFTENDVTAMLRGGVSPRRAAVLVGERGVDFALNDAAEQRLRKAGADDALLLAIAKAKK
jgi:PEGA domain-containing protein